MLTFRFEVDLKKKVNGFSRTEKAKRNQPVLRDSLVLAHYFVKQIENKKSDRTALAQAFGISSSRITQISHLCKLAPSIQEEILTNNPPIASRYMRQICQEPVWSKQIEMWNSLPQKA